ncbi:uncharacterized protein LOC121408020 isoform X2 [Lytechinus variegatus]|uniref:uncharacterized protein LOC121408020 isoform X2 n=1 Tax=Lytechinus variegatus TaxID=7654 RepID=UPI001BB26629|nr:uncharacterized protein LOC121408020 isoform X2 [Lytechinus variegatus]
MTSENLRNLAVLRSATSIADEIRALEAIKSTLTQGQTDLRSSFDLEEEFLSFASKNLGDEEVFDDPFPRTPPESIFPGQDDLDQLTCYVFRRRYGWSEAATSIGKDDRVGVPAGVLEGSGVMTAPQQKNQVILKNRLNELLDEFVRWYMAQPIGKPLLHSFRYTLAQAGDKPVVRNQTVIHTMDWLKLHKSHDGIHDNYSDIATLVMVGLTDIWSAIRKASVSRLPIILASLTVEEAENFFETLAKICQSKESSWQSIEGALMAINSLLRRFQWISREPVEPFFRGPVDKNKYFVKYGSEELTNIPAFITSRMHSIVYPLLAHQQLSVRECAIKAFTTFLSKCEFQEALSSFSEAISRLDQGSHLLSSQSKTEDRPHHQVPHQAVLKKDFKFLNAYEAEGLLGVCLYLVKHIPPGFLLPKWPFYFSVFSLYLMHPASTVRQATSELFRYLVVKDCNNSALLKLVLQGLGAHWGISIKYMSQPAHTLSHFHTLSHDHSNPTAATSHNATSADMRQEAAKRSQVVNRIEGHMVNISVTPDDQRPEETLEGSRPRVGTMGEVTSQSPRQNRRRQQPFYGQGKAISIVNVGQLEGDYSTVPVDSVLCKAWEWREGRLFAYELIMKFLIVNHIHYLFPTFAMQPMKFNGAASTDESITPSHKASRVPQGKPPIQKSLSHGGVSLRQAWLKRPPNDASTDDSSVHSPGAVVCKPPTSPVAVSPPISPPVHKGSPDEILSRAGSERRKKSVENKRAQTLAEGSFFNQPIMKHYSFPSTPEGNLPGGRRASHGLSGTLSLLGQTHDTDKNLKIETRNLLEESKSTLNDPIQPSPCTDDDDDEDVSLSSEARYLLKAYKSLTRNDRDTSKSSTPLPWLKDLHLDSLTNILHQIMLQTVNSLASSRWELRRMSQQALPLVAECLRWYHPETLVNFWKQCLTSEASLLCYGAAITLKHSIQHANRMMQYLQQPVAGWRRDSETCRQVSATIVVTVTQGLSDYVTTAKQLMEREVIDKLSVVAMEVLLISLAHFEEELEQEKDSLDEALHQFQTRIFSHAHPESEVCTQQARFTNAHDVLMPLDGFLCCCLRDENAAPHIRQLERYVLQETHCLILDYLRRCSPGTASQTLPLYLALLQDYQQDESISKTLLDGCCLLVTKVKGHITENGNSEIPKDFDNNLQLSLALIASLIKIKTLDLSTMRQMLEMYQDLSLCIQTSTHLQKLFSAIASRIDLIPLTKVSLNPTDDNMAGRLALFASNDIPASPVDTMRISDDEDDDDDRKGSSHPLSESLALNASSGSGQTPRLSSGSDQASRMAGVSPSPGTDFDDEDSDWDSWDEDEEDQSVFQEAMSDFLRQLQGYLGADTFQAELTHSSNSERQFIKHLLSN